MASMPGIVIKIGTDATNAVKGLDRVGKSLNKVDGAARKTKVAWKALGAGAAAAGAAFVAFSAESVQAFIEDEKAAAQLATTLKNMGFATRTAEVSAFIDNLQYAANVSEEQLRPAFSRLLRSTESVTQAQEILGVALDISAATGKDLDTVANALGKAYDGNAASLGRLGLGLDKGLLKSNDMIAIVEALRAKFGGANEAQANTLYGSLKGVQNAWGELQESFGKGLMTGGADGGAESLQQTEETLRRLGPEVEKAGGVVSGVATGIVGSFADVGYAAQAITQGDFADAMQLLLGEHTNTAGAWALQDKISGSLDAAANSATFAASQMNSYAASLERAAVGLAAVEGGTTSAVAGVSALGDALELASSGNYGVRIGEALTQRHAARAAAARAAARAKKKSDRIHAVKNAAGLADIVARAASRTGAKKATSRIQLSRQQCA
jgi:hypothetical protein